MKPERYKDYRFTSLLMVIITLVVSATNMSIKPNAFLIVTTLIMLVWTMHLVNMAVHDRLERKAREDNPVEMTKHVDTKTEVQESLVLLADAALDIRDFGGLDISVVPEEDRTGYHLHAMAWETTT